MLKKLTSPKVKAAHGASDAHRADADKEPSDLAAIPDDGEVKGKGDARSSKGASEKPAKSAADQAITTPTDQKQKKSTTKKPQDELKLNLGALGKAAGIEDDGTPQTDESLAKDRRKTLIRSPRTKNILNDRGDAGGANSGAPQQTDKSLAKERGGSMDRRKTLMRSPRTKNILDDESGLRGDTKPTPQGKKEANLKAAVASDPPPPSSPAKETKSDQSTTKGALSGLRALRSGRRSKKEAQEISDDKEIPTSSSTKGEDKQTAASSKGTKPKGRKKAEDKLESTRIDEQDKDKDPTNDKKKDQDNPEHRREVNQKTNSSLSPLRRRKPAPENDEPTGRLSSTDHLLGHRIKLRGLPPTNQPEVHIIGEITSGESFGSGGFACKWGVEYGSLWHHIAGDQLGQTQIDYPSSSSDPIVWSHPIDLHFATTSFSGWPKLLLQVWQTDPHMKTNVVGYGFMNLPFSPGEHHLAASLWRPMGSAKEELEAKLLGRTQELVSEDVVFNSAWADRCRLQTIATGKVHVQVGIILRNFHMSDLEM